MASKTVMQINSHGNKTLIAIMLDYVNEWRKSNGWSRATVAQEIVNVHDTADGPDVTGISFNFHPDVFTRQTNNADRIFRWLDDSSKDTNLLPANFITSIWMAMPMDIRIRCINEILNNVSVSARPMATSVTCFDAVSMLKNVMKENAEAEKAMVDLLDGATEEELMIANKEVSDVLVVATEALKQIETALVKMREK